MTATSSMREVIPTSLWSGILVSCGSILFGPTTTAFSAYPVPLTVVRPYSPEQSSSMASEQTPRGFELFEEGDQAAEGSGSAVYSEFDLASVPVYDLTDTNYLVSEIQNYSALPNEWDGPGTRAPSREVISDAIAFVQSWPIALGSPVVDVDGDGTITLELFCADGFAVAGVDFIGQGHQAVFSIVNGSRIVAADRFVATDQTAVLQTIAKIAESLA